MRTVKARDLIKLSKDEIMSMPDETMVLVFDDGEIISNTRRNMLSWFHWKLNVLYPKTPLLKSMHVGGGERVVFSNKQFVEGLGEEVHKRLKPVKDTLLNSVIEFGKQHLIDREKPAEKQKVTKDDVQVPYLKFPPYTTGTTLDIFSTYTRVIHETYGEGNYNREELWRHIYETINEIYNVFTIATEEHLTSSDVLDYLEIYDHPVVAALNATIKPTQKSLDVTYAGITKVILEDHNIRHNPVAQAARAGLVKLDQVCQMVGPRGYMTDIDSNIFQRPILTGYFEGITTLYDSMIESRSAAKALTFTKKPLRQVEYFNRKMQLLGSAVQGLIMGDCGTTKHLTIGIDKDNLKYIEGLYRIEKGGKLVAMTRKDTQLIGTVQRLRLPIHCRHRGTGHVCSTCFGELSYSVPAGTNLGHLCNIEMCQKGSQLVMSVKHYDGSSKVSDIALTEHDRQFLTDGSMISTLALNPDLAKRGGYLLLPIQQKGVAGAEGLGNVTPTTDISRFSIGRLTQFRQVVVGREEINKQTGEVVKMEDTVHVSIGNRYGSLTMEFLKHFQKSNYEITIDGYYRVPLEGWDFEQNVFELPMRHTNMLDVMSVIEAFIRSPRETNGDKRTRSLKKLADYDSADLAVIELCELVNERLDVNMAHMAVIVLATMRGTTDPYDYSIPDIDEPYVFESHSTLMENRSHGPLMAYERQPQAFENHESYLIKRRPPSILDELIVDRR